MCGRASLTKQEKELEQRFKATFYQEDIARYNRLPNYNVAPTHRHPVITNMDLDHLFFFQWGLIPFWSKDTKSGFKMINARVETLSSKPAFREAFKLRRCIVPFDGFYEWQKKEDGTKQPYLIRRKDNEIFCIAGVWEEWLNPAGEVLPTFSLITTSPNELMAEIHDRMPAILLPEQEKLWLSNDIPTQDLLQLLAPYPSELMASFPISSRVGNVRENDPSLLEPI